MTGESDFARVLCGRAGFVNRRTRQGTLIVLGLASALQLAAPSLRAEEAVPLAIEEKIQYARDNYDFGLFDTALGSLTELQLLPDLTTEQVQDVHVLKAACEIRLGLEDEAIRTCCALRARIPAWTPGDDPIESSLRPTFERSKGVCPDKVDKVKKGSPWKWILGGGAAVGAVLALVLGGGGDGGEKPTDSTGVGDYPPPPGAP